MQAPHEMPPGVFGLVYGLRDLRQEDFRYVGITRQHRPIERLWKHWSDARSGKHLYVSRWLAKRLHEQHVVEMVTLEVVMTNADDLAEAEIRWIERLREQGHRLTNIAAGGGGLVDVPWTEERRQAHLARMAEFRHTDETKALMSRQRKGTRTGADNPNYGKFGPAHPSYGVKRSEETRRRLSEQKRGERNPNYGKKFTAEEKLQRSLALKGRPMPSSVRNAHTRHHTNKGVFKETCRHCLDDRAAAQS